MDHPGSTRLHEFIIPSRFAFFIKDFEFIRIEIIKIKYRPPYFIHHPRDLGPAFYLIKRYDRNFSCGRQPRREKLPNER